jgi:hypothetical protein
MKALKRRYISSHFGQRVDTRLNRSLLVNRSDGNFLYIINDYKGKTSQEEHETLKLYRQKFIFKKTTGHIKVPASC